MQQKIHDLIAEVAILKDKEEEARKELENERKIKAESVKHEQVLKSEPKPIY
jgi:hypothetical protein